MSSSLGYILRLNLLGSGLRGKPDDGRHYFRAIHTPGPWFVAYVASNEEHGWRNAGSTPAQYFVLAIGAKK